MEKPKIEIIEWKNYIEVVVDGVLYCTTYSLDVAKEVSNDLKEGLYSDNADICIRTYAASKQ